MGAALWSVKQTRSAPNFNSLCPLTGKPIDKGRAWSMFHGYDAVDESAETGAPEALQVAVSELNRRGITDMDDAQVGLAEAPYMVNAYCPMERGRNLPVSKREVDAVVGLRQGERVHGISLDALHKHAPTLERYLSERFGTPIYEPPAPPAPPSADEVAQAERAAKQLQATLNVARALAGSMATPRNEDVGRAALLLQSVKDYFSA